MRAAFRQDGYVSQIPILSAGALRRAQAWVAELESRRDRGMLQPQEVNLHLRGERHAWELASHPRVINVARELLGVSDIFCMSTTLFTKYPSKRAGPKRVGWHQDVLHWNLHPPEVLNVWLALDDADEENGCMRVVPRSHTRGILPHRHDPADTNNVLMGYQDIDEQAVLGLGADGSPAVSLPLCAGECSVHDGFTVHGSAPNTSVSRRRCGFTAQYMPAHVHIGEDVYQKLDKTHNDGDNDDKDDWRRPVLVAGVDCHNLNDARKQPVPVFS